MRDDDILEYMGLMTKQKQKQTNEEWFCGLSTERKAKVLIELIIESRQEGRYGLDYPTLFNWLKEKHNE